MPLKIIYEDHKMVVYKKVKIEKAWEDIQPNFPPFRNLHLELLETEKKLKSNLPPIPCQHIQVVQ